MDDIAEAAGVSKPVLYQHFESKLDLYLALLDRSCERLADVVAEALKSTEDNAERVVAAVGAFYDFVSAASGEFRFVFESDLTGDNTVQRRLWRVNNDIADAIARVIAEDTALPVAESKLLAISLVGLAQVSARFWVSAENAQQIPLAEAKELVSSLAWRGLRGFPLTEHDRRSRRAEATRLVWHLAHSALPRRRRRRAIPTLRASLLDTAGAGRGTDRDQPGLGLSPSSAWWRRS